MITKIFLESIINFSASLCILLMAHAFRPLGLALRRSLEPSDRWFTETAYFPQRSIVM